MAAQAPLLRIGLSKFLGRSLSHFQIFLTVSQCLSCAVEAKDPDRDPRNQLRPVRWG
jgi:hypothetical protein